MSKQCSKCKKKKPLSEFPKDKHRQNGLYPYCRPCKNKAARDLYHAKGEKRFRPQTATSKKWHRERHIQVTYGLTVEQHKQMYVGQNGCCLICGKSMEYNKIHTDHDHVTGKVRGLLCVRCNLGMSFIDDSNFMQRAAKYVK